MAYPTLLAVCTTAGLLLVTGCAALGLLGGSASMDAQSENPRSGSPQPMPGLPSPTGHSIFDAVAWGFAVIAGALGLAFVAKLLNGRVRSDPAGAASRIPASAAAVRTTES